MAINGIYNLSNTIMSGYNQMHQMRAMLAMGNRNPSALMGAGSGVGAINKLEKLDAESAKFLKDYQSKMDKMASAADAILNPKKVDKNTAGAEDGKVAQVSGKLQNVKDSYELTVTQVAKGQVNSSKELLSKGTLPSIGGGLSIETETGIFHYNLSSAGAKTNEEALQKFADQINKSDSGVSAKVISKDGKSRLELTGPTGANSSFSVSGSAAESLGLDNVVSKGQDAVYTVTKNGKETYSGTSSTNNIEVDGLSITLKGEGKTAIKSAQDSGITADAMQDLVNSFNDTLKFLNDNSKKGVGVLQQMKRMILSPASDESMAMLGISVNQDGTLALDKDAFEKAMEKSPKFITSIAENIASGVKQDALSGKGQSSASLLSNVQQKQKNHWNPVLGTQQDSLAIMNMYNRTGAYNMSNYYTVGMMMNLFI